MLRWRNSQVWGLLLLLEHEVDIEALPLLDDGQIKVLIPAIGPQAKFKKALSDWKLTHTGLDSESSVTITWYKGERQIDSSWYTNRGTHSELIVTPQSDEDFGPFTCKAECAVGTHHRTIELVQRPVVEELHSDGPKLSWKIYSHQPLKSIQIQLISEDSPPYPIEVPVPETRTHEYDMSYIVDASVKPGNYGVVVKVENSKGMSESTEQIVYEQVETEPMIQHASVFVPGAASTSRPTTALLSTVLMYLLVRMI